MTINYTTLLGLALPVTGTESGTWGDDVSNGITQYIDASVAGTQSITTDADVTLSLTNGSSAGTNLGATSAQYMQLLCTGSRTAARYINVPNSSKMYVVNNSTTGGYSITVRGVTGPTTGVTVINGEKAIIYWNSVSSDFVKISSNTITSFTGVLSPVNGGTGVANNAASTITISGSFGTTLTVTGTTAVTLPTTGTLLTTTGSGSSLTFGTGSLALAGNLTTTGAFASTFTVTGAYTYTLPAATDTLVNLGSSQTLTSKTLTNPTVTNYVETLYAPSAGSAFTISLANGTVQEISLNANGTITLPSSVAGKSFTIIVTYSGSYSLTWSGGGTLKWAGGTTPTATSTSGKYDIFNFYQDGTNTYGSVYGLNY